MLGAIAQNAEDLLDSSQSIADVLTQGGGAGAVDAFIAGVLTLTALIATGYTVSSGLRLRAEETSGRLEPLLATSTGRLRWAASHVVMSLAGSAIVLTAAGLGIGLAHAIVSHDAGELPRLVGAALAQLPAVWVLGAIVVALFGFLPRAVALAWAALGACLLLWFIGPLLGAPGWLLEVSPYEHIPAVPAVTVAAGPLLALAAVATALTAAGLAGFRRRDVA